MKLSEKITSFLEWVDDEDATSTMPEWMGELGWCDFEDGSTEAWEFVLLRETVSEIAQLEAELKQTNKLLREAVEYISWCDDEAARMEHIVEAARELINHDGHRDCPLFNDKEVALEKALEALSL